MKAVASVHGHSFIQVQGRDGAKFSMTHVCRMAKNALPALRRGENFDFAPGDGWPGGVCAWDFTESRRTANGEAV